MTKKHFKLVLFLLCFAMISVFGAKTIAQAEEKKEPEVAIQTGAYGELVNVESGKCLNVKKNSSAQEAAVTIYQKDGTTGQKWQFLSFPNGYSLIPECAASTGRVLNIYGYSAQAGSRICLWSSTQSDTQSWIVEAFEDGSFVLRSKSNPELCLAESGAGNGSAITLKAYSETDKSIRWTSSLVTVTKTEEPEEPKVIKLSTENVRTYKGIPIKLVLENADAAKVTWKTSSSSKGTVSKDGIVTAKKKNCTFTVYATYEGVKYSVKVKVEKNDPKYQTYSAKTYYAKKNDVPVYVDPHSSATVVKRLSQNTTILVVGQISNVANNTWYITDEGYYIYHGNCSTKPLYTAIEEITLFAQRRETMMYSNPDVNSDTVGSVPINTKITMIGELTDKDGVKWYVTYEPENAKKICYVLATDYAENTFLNSVVGCTAHYRGCTFCSTVTMIRRRAVFDGICDSANVGNAVTYNMIDCYSGGLKYAYTYAINGGTYSTAYFSDARIHNPQFLADLCALHPEGVVIFDEWHARHAVCVADCAIDENGNYHFYVYDINKGNGETIYRLEDSDIYIRNGFNMDTLFRNLSVIVYVP